MDGGGDSGSGARDPVPQTKQRRPPRLVVVFGDGGSSSACPTSSRRNASFRRISRFLSSLPSFLMRLLLPSSLLELTIPRLLISQIAIQLWLLLIYLQCLLYEDRGELHRIDMD